jgi:hypothetical protein
MLCWSSSSDHRKYTTGRVLLQQYLLTLILAIRYFTPLKRVPSPPDFAANMPCDDTHLVKNDALHASFAKLSALPRPSPSRPKSERMGQGEQQDTISI